MVVRLQRGDNLIICSRFVLFCFVLCCEGVLSSTYISLNWLRGPPHALHEALCSEYDTLRKCPFLLQLSLKPCRGVLRDK